MPPTSGISKNKQGTQRIRSSNRTLIACVHCKERKLKCDDRTSGCENCRRWGVVCLVEDPSTRRQHPRNYLETLEQRVAYLENVLKQYRPDLANDHLSPHHAPTLNPTTERQPDTPSTVSKAHADDEKPNELDGLASKVGLLSLSAAGAEPHYLGSSSTFAFARLINSSLRQVVLPRPNTVDAPRQTEEDTPCSLPEFEIAITLSDAYFRHAHPHYPFLHEPTFRAWEQMMLGSTNAEIMFDPVPLFFLNMVYAIGALLIPTSGYSARRLYISAQMYIDHILLRENLETIQAILCCAVYSLRSSIGTSHWKLAGLALRQCIDLGYHCSSKRLRYKASPLQLELQKRAFWCAYAMESQAAVMLGRPQGIPHQEVDAEYPTDIDDIGITDTGIHGIARTLPSDAPTVVTKAIHTFRIRRLLARIHSTLYSNSSPCCPGEHDQNYHIPRLRTEIEEWRANIPTTSSSGDALSLFSTDDWFNLEYNYTILQLYRVQIADHRETAPDSVFFDSLQAAESICHSYRRQFLGKTMSYTWTALHELFLAGLTYLHCLWSSPAARQAYRQGQVSSTCTDCTIVLVIMAERWDAAAPYRDIFGMLANRTMMMMDEKAESWALPIAPSQSENEGDQELMEWMAHVTNMGMAEGFDTLLTSFVGAFGGDGPI
ncbi:putative transcriptional activator protein acu-15 [Aspergillus karnatakaensis]|uniref:putative transcriptional activator protein acu-15 n=1 Tax=Aspergillus karnatakaensis TaxID=1810916 RepID=UPI003CCD7A53